MSDRLFDLPEEDPPSTPVIPRDAPLFSVDTSGRLHVEWPGGDGPVLVSREALQMLVDRANVGTRRLFSS